MVSLMEEIRIELKKKKANKRIVDLWEDIYKWYEDGGEKTVTNNINTKIEEIGKKFRKEVEEAKIIARLKKKPRKKR